MGKLLCNDGFHSVDVAHSYRPDAFQGEQPTKVTKQGNEVTSAT